MNSVELHAGSSLPFWAFLLILIAGTMIGAGIGYICDAITLSESTFGCSVIMFLLTGIAIIFIANPSHAENIKTVEQSYGVNSAAFIPVDGNTTELTAFAARGSDGRHNYTYIANGGKKYNVSVKIYDGKMTMMSDNGIIKPNGKWIQ